MQDRPRIVIVDDDTEIAGLLQEYFEANGLSVTAYHDGTSFRAFLQQDTFDLAVLDLRLPDDDGLALCRLLRDQPQTVGIVMLTGAGDSVDKVVGLELGADDYIAKPFELREVLARVRAVLRRVQVQPVASVSHASHQPLVKGESFRFGTVSVDVNNRHLERADGEVEPLTSMEFELLQAFHERPGRILSRTVLLEAAHGKDWEPFDRSIDVRVTRLRKKIEPDPTRPVYIKTVRGVGYRYDPDGA